jgi:hypothetical protein
MSADHRVILALIAMGRITRAEAARKALSPITGPITDLTPLTRVEGLL